jgi:murein DD-endopeptidase MepM/ murein hydrolase activator NlpD
VKDLFPKTKKIVEQIKVALSNSINWTSQRWKGMSPGFRYALVYFVCVLVVAGLVFWQYSPARTLVFDPSKQGEIPRDPDAEDEDVPGNEESPYVSLAAIEEGRETLALPVQGDIILSCGEVFSTGYHRITDGIHISGTRGDSVYAAFQGLVATVIEPGENEAGEVWIDHGDFQTRYINVEFIEVKTGDYVSTNQKIGELAAKMQGNHTEDYLVFEVWDADGEPWDPERYVGLDR